MRVLHLVDSGLYGKERVILKLMEQQGLDPMLGTITRAEDEKPISDGSRARSVGRRTTRSWR